MLKRREGESISVEQWDSDEQVTTPSRRNYPDEGESKKQQVARKLLQKEAGKELTLTFGAKMNTLFQARVRSLTETQGFEPVPLAAGLAVSVAVNKLHSAAPTR